MFILPQCPTRDQFQNHVKSLPTRVLQEEPKLQSIKLCSDVLATELMTNFNTFLELQVVNTGLVNTGRLACSVTVVFKDNSSVPS